MARDYDVGIVTDDGRPTAAQKAIITNASLQIMDILISLPAGQRGSVLVAVTASLMAGNKASWPAFREKMDCEMPRFYEAWAAKTGDIA